MGQATSLRGMVTFEFLQPFFCLGHEGLVHFSCEKI